MDNYARGLRAAAKMIEEGTLDKMRKVRVRARARVRVRVLTLTLIPTLTLSLTLSLALTLTVTLTLTLTLKGRYAGFAESDIGKKFSAGKASLADLAEYAAANPEPQQRSAQCEKYESVFNAFALKG